MRFGIAQPAGSAADQPRGPAGHLHLQPHRHRVGWHIARVDGGRGRPGRLPCVELHRAPGTHHRSRVPLCDQLSDRHVLRRRGSLRRSPRSHQRYLVGAVDGRLQPTDGNQLYFVGVLPGRRRKWRRHRLQRDDLVRALRRQHSGSDLDLVRIADLLPGWCGRRLDLQLERNLLVGRAVSQPLLAQGRELSLALVLHGR